MVMGSCKSVVRKLQNDVAAAHDILDEIARDLAQYWALVAINGLVRNSRDGLARR